MVVARREVWWADLDEPRDSEPGFRLPVLIVQADAFNAQLLTIDEDYLTDRAGQLSRRLMGRVESGLRLVLGLWQPVE